MRHADPTYTAKRLAALASAAAFVVATVAACGLTGTSGSGPVVTETRDTGTFTRIEADHGIAVTVKVGPAASMQVEAQQNLLPIIETRVDGGILHITGNVEFAASSRPRVVLTTPTLDGIVLSSGSQGQLDGLANDRFAIEIDGGAGLTATGTSADVSIDGNGGATADLQGLSAQSVNLDLSGGAVAHISASDHVVGDVSGGAHLVVTGDAAVDVSASGGGNVSHG